MNAEGGEPVGWVELDETRHSPEKGEARCPRPYELAIPHAPCHNNLMSAITFDTLKFTKRLKAAGFTEPQAEAIADSFLQATGEAEVATKRDIERLEAKIDRVEAKLVGELTLVKWMLGLLLGGVMALVLKTFFPS